MRRCCSAACSLDCCGGLNYVRVVADADRKTAGGGRGRGRGRGRRRVSRWSRLRLSLPRGASGCRLLRLPLSFLQGERKKERDTVIDPPPSLPPSLGFGAKLDSVVRRSVANPPVRPSVSPSVLRVTCSLPPSLPPSLPLLSHSLSLRGEYSSSLSLSFSARPLFIK